MSYAIRAQGLGKRYDINRGGKAHRSLAELLDSVLRLKARRSSITEDGTNQATVARHTLDQELWALKDVEFEIAEGERVGVIGANGAGKSTLLKILSRITTPTEGSVEIRGKVSSLLEVGTGFHPELTGRENIFLNGAILGMTGNEIRGKFDQIVEFSGVEKFIDTPVKRYSSGMYVRLAFSVSAWLDPDILIVDEVLSVGDAAFQKKCAARMKELTKEGRTVLFVSHSMSAVQQMCEKALYLESGRVVGFNSVEEITLDYHRNVEGAEHGYVWHRAEFNASDGDVEILVERDGEAECLGGSLENEDGKISTHFPIDKPVHINLRYKVLKKLPYDVVPSFNFYNETGQIFYICSSASAMPGEPGEYSATCVLPPYFLNNQRFMVDLNLVSFSLAEKPAHFAAVHALRFEICEESPIDPRRHGWKMPIPGLLRARLEWRNSAL